MEKKKNNWIKKVILLLCVAVAVACYYLIPAVNEKYE